MPYPRLFCIIVAVTACACSSSTADQPASDALDSGTSDALDRADAATLHADSAADAPASEEPDAADYDAGFDAQEPDHNDSADADTSNDAGLDAPADSGSPDSSPAVPQCQRTICLTGAINQQSPGNNSFTTLCSDPRIPGLIESCDDDKCEVTFSNFMADVAVSIYPTLFAALDTNGDEVIDDEDDDCALNILGFSWGGVNSLRLARAYLEDSRVAPSRQRIYRVIVLDPFQPGGKMHVPSQVEQFIEYRHSIAPSSDCSIGAPLGPYLGIAPRCEEPSRCLDYDYSLAPSKAFACADGSVLYGRQVEHCSVPQAAHQAVIANLLGEPYENLPPSVPVEAI